MYNIRAVLSESVRNLSGPFLVLANHVGFWDPFVVSYFLRKRPHFVSSDAVMRDPVKRFFLKGFGVIPKKKNIRDTKVIRDMTDYIGAGEAIGLFPEATRTWTGTTLYIDPSIAKLVKLLKVPVVSAKMKGMFLFNPRWSYKVRKGRVDVDYDVIITSGEIQQLGTEEIYERIKKALWHNETDYQQTEHIRIKSDKRAEFMNHVLFYCPLCNSFEGYHAHKNTLTCKYCGSQIYVDQYGFFRHAKDDFQYKDIAQAFAVQNKAFESFVKNALEQENDPLLFSEDRMNIYRTEGNDDFELSGTGLIEFYGDRIVLKIRQHDDEILYLKNIETLNAQLFERIEIFSQNKVYRFAGREKGVSGIRWEIASNIVWRHIGQSYKASKYFDPY
jgi:1-acyl-sn-glycerol-3-phosphate acyltransferase